MTDYDDDIFNNDYLDSNFKNRPKQDLFEHKSPNSSVPINRLSKEQLREIVAAKELEVSRKRRANVSRVNSVDPINRLSKEQLREIVAAKELEVSRKRTVNSQGSNGSNFNKPMDSSFNDNLSQRHRSPRNPNDEFRGRVTSRGRSSGVRRQVPYQSRSINQRRNYSSYDYQMNDFDRSNYSNKKKKSSNRNKRMGMAIGVLVLIIVFAIVAISVTNIGLLNTNQNNETNIVNISGCEFKLPDGSSITNQDGSEVNFTVNGTNCRLKGIYDGDKVSFLTNSSENNYRVDKAINNDIALSTYLYDDGDKNTAGYLVLFSKDNSHFLLESYKDNGGDNGTSVVDSALLAPINEFYKLNNN